MHLVSVTPFVYATPNSLTETSLTRYSTFKSVSQCTNAAIAVLVNLKSLFVQNGTFRTSLRMSTTTTPADR